MKRVVAVSLAMAVVLLGARPGAAFDLGEWVPGLKLSPFLSQRFEYETNVFQTSSNEESDWISKTIPGFLADYSFGPHSISLGYRAEILEYFRLTDQNTVNHIALGELRLDFPLWLGILRDDFVHTSEPPNTELSGPIESSTNTLTSSFEYRFTPRLSAGVSVAWRYIDFEQSVNDLDRNEFLFGATVYWKFVPRADVNLSYAYGFKTFTVAGDRDVTRNIINLGLRGEITPKLSSTFRVGYEIRTGEHQDQSNYSGLILGGGFDWRPIEGLTLNLGVDRNVQESVFGSAPYYVTTGSSLALQRQINKVTVSARAAGGFNDYQTKQTVGTQTDFRQDWYWGVGTGLDYDFRPWLRLGVEYLYLGRNSNFNDFDFNDHRVSLKATLQF